MIKLGTAATIKFGTAESGDPLLIERSSDNEFTRRHDARNSQGEIDALVMRGAVLTTSETRYADVLELPDLGGSGNVATTSVELMATNQDFVKVKKDTKTFEFGV
jgi:hypothetical protein